jgi:hypothetical protein
LLTETESANGFANRYLFPAVRRSKYLPEGGNIDAENLNDLVTRLHSAIEFARQAGESPGAMKRVSCGQEFILSFQRVNPACLARSRPGLRLKSYAGPAAMHFSTARQRSKSIICAQHSRCGDTAKIPLIGFLEPGPATRMLTESLRR